MSRDFAVGNQYFTAVSVWCGVLSIRDGIYDTIRYERNLRENARDWTKLTAVRARWTCTCMRACLQLHLSAHARYSLQTSDQAEAEICKITLRSPSLAHHATRTHSAAWQLLGPLPTGAQQGRQAACASCHLRAPTTRHPTRALVQPNSAHYEEARALQCQ